MLTEPFTLMGRNFVATGVIHAIRDCRSTGHAIVGTGCTMASIVMPNLLALLTKWCRMAPVADVE